MGGSAFHQVITLSLSMVGRKQARQTKELRIDWERGKGREIKGKGKKEGKRTGQE